MAKRRGEHVPGRANSVCKGHVLRGENGEYEEGSTCVKHREKGMLFREEERKWVETRLDRPITSHYSFVLRATEAGQ